MNNTVIIEKIQQQIQKNPVLLYMKGTPHTIKCGFSSKASKILSLYITSFTYIDVLTNPDIRYTLPSYANWPTFPQLWVETKLIGGFDIIFDMHQNGSLKTLLNSVKLKFNLN